MRILLIAIFCLLCLPSAAFARVSDLLPVPKVVHMAEHQEPGPRVTGKVRMCGHVTPRLRQALMLATGWSLDDGRKALPVEVALVDSIGGAWDHVLAGFDNEAYSLRVTASGIAIEAVTEVGAIRAFQTLAQLAEGTPRHGRMEAVSITDWPAFKLRGYMHDCGRSYIPVDMLERQMCLMARFKVNVLHLHLTENQAWRFEVRAFPQLTRAGTMTRHEGCFYTQSELHRLDSIAWLLGVTILPEVDMPGHSAAFKRAMGHSMQTPEGVEELKVALTELAATFGHAPYIHIGADEETITYPGFLRQLTDHVHALGRKVVVWNPIRGMSIDRSTGADMTQMWSTAGRAVEGVPNIDCRYNYVNHFDLFADLAGIYRSNIYYASRGSAEVAGAIAAVWNDRRLPSAADIMAQNNVYACVLATCERAWKGGGAAYIEQGGALLPPDGAEHDEFADWERRFVYHRDHVLRDEPIAYVRQANVRWRISDAFPNDGDAARSFPPESLLALPAGTPPGSGADTAFVHDGRRYATHIAAGAAVYLRHTWGTVVPAFYQQPQPGATAYAWTYIYSPRRQRAAAMIELQNYSRSERDVPPPPGRWDGKGSHVWLNGTELMPPEWTTEVDAGGGVGHETLLTNENAAARQPVPLQLRRGWNLVMLKLPYVDVPGIRLNKWMFTFVVTTPDGRRALPGISYAP